MVGRRPREQTRLMTLPTVIEITPQLEAVTPDTFIDTLAAETFARFLRDGWHTATAVPRPRV
jgi:hypothetical protein